MIQIHLDPTKAHILRMALESYLSDSRMGIANTDVMDFGEKLKARKMVLRRFVALINAGRRLAEA